MPEIAIPIKKQPDISEKILSNQISKIEMKIGEGIIDLLGLPIIRQMLIYNPVYPSNPFEVDIYIPDKDLALDVNGKYHKEDKYIQRQIRKDRAVKGLTGIAEYHLLDVSTPPELLYWDKKGGERERIKEVYEIYSQGLIMNAVNIVRNAKFRPTVQTPVVLKSEDNFERGQERLKELRKNKH